MGRHRIAFAGSHARWVLAAALALVASACGGGDATEPTAAPPPTVSVERIANDAFGGDGSQRIHAVAASDTRLVGVGVDSSQGDLDAAVWTSVDGSAWERVAHDDDLFGGSGRQIMNGVVAGGPGFVAVGIDQTGSNRDAAVWTSADGLTWVRVDDESVLGGAGGQQMNAVAVGGPGLVAVGSVQSGADRVDDAAVWTSADGLTWSRVEHVEAVFGHEEEPEFGEGDQVMHAVTAGGPGLVAVGTSATSARGNLDAAVWTSTDGLTWIRVDPLAEALVGGDDQSWEDPDPDVAMTGIEVTDDGLVAVGWIGAPDARDARTWTSPDGIEWTVSTGQETVLGGEGLQMMAAVQATDDWLVAVGADTSMGTTDAAIWVSADGRAWSRIAEIAGLADAGDESMSGLAILGPSVIPVGVGGEVSDPSAAVWVVSLTAPTP